VKEEAAISLKGATVLELGAGMGLCGLLAAQLGAREVVITDCSYVGLNVLLRNCNDARGVVQVDASILQLPSLCKVSHTLLRCAAEIWVLQMGHAVS
jgi:predicted RNA methylase